MSYRPRRKTISSEAALLASLQRPSRAGGSSTVIPKGLSTDPCNSKAALRCSKDVVGAFTKVLGIDPATNTTGYGIVQTTDGRFSPVDFGCISPPKKLHPQERYLALFDSVEALIATFRPEVVAVETAFVWKNPQTAFKLGIARASVLLAAARAQLPVFEYAPCRIKQSVTGYGQASKEQMQRMVQTLLMLRSPPTPHDAADALAIALCCFYQEKNGHSRQ